jgi:hypothetical protein
MSNYNSNLQTNNTNLQELIDIANNLPNAGGSEPILQDKTITPTISEQTVTADSGYDGLDTVTVNAIPVVEKATPFILVGASGLITAKTLQVEGYVTSGQMTGTRQLATQDAKTITPTTTDQTAVQSARYTTGAITVKGDSNLVADNIKEGTSIFGVVGTYAGSGGSGDTSVEDAFITRTITSITNDRVRSIGNYAFASCTSLTSVSFPNATTIGSYAFYYCSKLTTISFPNATTIGSNAFCYCSKLTTISFPNATTIGIYAFNNCSNLTSISFPKATTIGNNAFYRCSKLTTIYLTNSSVCKLSNSNAFSSTGIGSDKGSIFVPASLLTSYKTATNWTYFSNRIFGV